MRHSFSGWRVGLVAALAVILAVGGWLVQTHPGLTIHVDLGLDGTPSPAPGTPHLLPTATPAGARPASPTALALPAATATLPAALGTVVRYTIREGDTLSGIAVQYGTTVAAIRARNRITDPNLLFVGAPLEIVVGEQPAAPTATPRATALSSPVARPTAPLAGAAPLVGAATPAALSALEPTRPAQPPSAYDVYIPTASKTGQYYHFTCEFDASWAIFKTYGIDVSLDDQLGLVGVDTSVVPTYKETPQGVEIRGGDIANAYSGDYQTNFLARTTGAAMRKVFAHYGLATTPVHDQAGLENALRAGQLVWIKTTVDFAHWVPAVWIGPDGHRYGTVLGNDHAVVVAGYNAKAVLIRDVLGPTSTNAHRLEEYEVSWPTFLAAWGAQSYDGLAVAKP